MRNKIFVVVSLLMVASMALAACAQPTAAPTSNAPQVQVTQVVKTVVVTQEGKTIIVTATPEPTAGPQAIAAKDTTTFTEATFGDPETLDPALDYETAGGSINLNIYDTLIFYNREDPNSFVPQLATEVPSTDNGGISSDGMTYTFKIRQGVKFQDGTDLTPDDVAFTFQRGLLQGGSSSPQWLLAEPILGTGTYDVADLIDPSLEDDVQGLQATDPAKLAEVCKTVTDKIVADDSAGTVTFHLAQAWGPFLATVAQTWGSIQSKAWVAANGGWDGDCATWQNFYGKTSDQLNEAGLGTKAMGTGPYSLDHWTPGEEIVLKANENYWRTDPAWDGGPTGAPALKTVIIKNVSEFSTRYSMLLAGDADVISVGSQSDYPQMDQLVGEKCQKTVDDCQPSDNPNNPLRVVLGLPGVSRTDAFMNFQVAEGSSFIGSGKLDGNGIPADFFSDIHVRKAFAYCFNYDAYLNDVMLGEGVRSVDVMLPGMIGYNENDPTYTYDPDKCTQEFQASTLKSTDGKSLWDTGFRMTIAYNTGNTSRQTIAQIFQQELSAVNDKFLVEVTGLPWPAFLKAQRAKQLPLFVSGWLEDINDPHNWVVPYTIQTYGGLQSLPKDLVAQFQDIINRGVSESDPAKRSQIYAEFNKLFYDNIPTILLYVPLGRHYEQRWVQGYYYNPIYSGPYFYVLSKK